MSDIGLFWRIEEACFNAFPALKQVLFGDWLMRFGAGVSRRANSVNRLRNPLRPESADIATAIAAAEVLYRGQGLPAIFRVPSIVDPALDRELAARFYTGEGESCVLHGDIDALKLGTASLGTDLRLLAAPDAEWLSAMARLQGHTRSQNTIYRRIVGAIAIPARFALVAVDGAPAALAYGAVHDGLLVYESVITDRRYRRGGLARQIIASLATWAHGCGATGACLQVEAGNAPARALYARFGLAQLYRYHYRRAPDRT